MLSSPFIAKEVDENTVVMDSVVDEDAFYMFVEFLYTSSYIPLEELDLAARCRRSLRRGDIVASKFIIDVSFAGSGLDNCCCAPSKTCRLVPLTQILSPTPKELNQAFDALKILLSAVLFQVRNHICQKFT